MPRTRIFTPVVCLIASVVVLGSFFLASRGEASPGAAAPPAAPDQSARNKINDAYGKLPISFVANEGQMDARVKFMSRGRGYSLYLTQTGAVMVLTRSQVKPNAAPNPAGGKSDTSQSATKKSSAATPPRTLSNARSTEACRKDKPGVADGPCRRQR